MNQKPEPSTIFKKGDVVIVRNPPSFYGKVGVITSYARYSEFFGGHQWRIKYADGGMSSETEQYINLK